MATCNSCGGSFGLLELKRGECKGCRDKANPPCLGCRKSFPPGALNEKGFCGLCEGGRKSRIEQQREIAEQAESAKEKRLNLEVSDEDDRKKMESIMLTTEMAPNIEILERLEIITAECVFGMNIFKDFFVGVRDFIGGRSAASQNVLRDARKTVLAELKKEAFNIGANAVIAIDLDYSEISGKNSSMLFVVASGTAIRMRDDKN